MRLVGQFAPHESKAFHVFNRGKRGIVLNLAEEAGRAVAHRLVRDFDVFLINARPGVPARLGLDYETLRAERPDLIYLDNTAYGPEGPSAHRAGADIIAQAYSGLMAGDEKFNEDDGPQLITATTPADFSAAYSSAIGVCAALYHRERTGEGQRIQTSLLASALTLENAFVSRLPVSDAVLLDPTLEAIEAARERGASWRELQTARGGTPHAGRWRLPALLRRLPDERRRGDARLRHAEPISNRSVTRSSWATTPRPTQTSTRSTPPPLMSLPACAGGSRSTS